VAGYTRGPWTQHGSLIVKFGVDGRVICEMSEPRELRYIGHIPLRLGSPDRNEQMANARLMSAAPDLLEAAIGLSNARTPAEVEAAYAVMAAAIAKATEDRL
jgi:hypothetical protein